MKKHRRHLKTRKSKPFNVLSKAQEDSARIASNMVWDELVARYPQYEFNNLKSLKLSDLDAKYAIDYINRGLRRTSMSERRLDNLQAIDSAGGIKPDGGIFFVQSKIDGFNHIIGALEVKHQGEYTGYTPISDSDWKKKGKDTTVQRKDRPPQAQGNAIERFAKNSNAIRSLTSIYGYNPYAVFCEGFDFFLKEDFHIFSQQPHSRRFQSKDSSILMRLIAGNDWMPLNKVYVTSIPYGRSKLCPATIFARMPKWSPAEISQIMLDVIHKSLMHLQSIDEL